LKQEDRLEALDIEGRIYKLVLKETECGGVDWIKITQDRDKWQAFVKTVMNLQVPLNAWNLTSCYCYGNNVTPARQTAHTTSKG
jgi:hypothetical protein